MIILFFLRYITRLNTFIPENPQWETLGRESLSIYIYIYIYITWRVTDIGRLSVMEVLSIRWNKTVFLPMVGVSRKLYECTQHLDTDKTYREKNRRERHKNTARYIDQHPTKQQPNAPISNVIKGRLRKHAGDWWRSKDELISDVLLWTPSHRRVQLTSASLQQLCVDTEYCLENLPGAMVYNNGWREIVRKIRTSSLSWWWRWWWYYILYVCVCMWVCLKWIDKE